MKQAVIIYGPPGSGKGTQAELLARKFNFVHFDTGNHLRRVLYDPKNKNNKEIQKERNLNEKGFLNTPAWVLKVVKGATARIARADYGVVYSGSPRTLFEAFGDAKKPGLLDFLNKVYGKKNIRVIKLNIKGETSLKRNKSRFTCSVCGLPILAAAKQKNCAFCAGPAKRRADDNPKIIKNRLKEYRQRTYPILAKMRRLGYKVIEINGEPPPYKVHDQIVRALYKIPS